MPNLVGQQELQDKLERWKAENSFPRFLVIEGPAGHGKTLLARYAAQLTCSDIVEYGNKVDDARQLVADSQALQKSRIALFQHAHEMTIQAQNALLKTLEEPPMNMCIIFEVETVTTILPTILSRASHLRMAAYTSEQLRQFTDNELLLDICQNPGEIERMKSNVDNLYSTAKKIVENLHKTSAANVFNILHYFKEQDYPQVVSILIKLYEQNIRQGMHMLEHMRTLYRYKGHMANRSLNKKNLMEHLFIELREASIRGPFAS